MNLRSPLALFLVGCLAAVPSARASLGDESYVSSSSAHGGFAIAGDGHAAPILVSPEDFPGVLRAAHDLASDIATVTGLTPSVSDLAGSHPVVAVIAGTLGHSHLIDSLVAAHKLNPKGVTGKWDAFGVYAVDFPFPGIDHAFVIVGANKRGTIYGIYDLSQQIGVSPWAWWADVPSQHRDAIWISPGLEVTRAPSVKYRGIFLNDEAPALSGWVMKQFGGYNSKFYTKVFELILRLRGNALWPAMWNSRFNEDDPQNPILADEYGIVMGTSHHEPLMRAQKEWTHHGTGPWDYEKNEEVLRQFWTFGVHRNRAFENLYTIGMRGDGDKPMAEGTDVPLLERIVADQRKILADEVSPDLPSIPQVFALYKEVQAYYENGMKVPDDVTLLWADDNFGNVRRLPTAQERRERTGGAGIYYHVDYVGDPRNYKWICTVPIEKIREQMDLAYEYGADRLWIVNVGDLKPMEFDLEFFLNLAWDPHRWPADSLVEYTKLWARREFGGAFAGRIANLESATLKFLGRRKPEVLEPSTFSVADYHEADRIESDYDAMIKEADALSALLPDSKRDAFFELVGYPAKASATVGKLYIQAGRNHLYAAQGRLAANDAADAVAKLFQTDADLSAKYNHEIAGGKWDHMMDQTHIGYTFWNEPKVNVAPATQRVVPTPQAAVGVAIDGSTDSWPAEGKPCELPALNSISKQTTYLDLFNRGPGAMNAKVEADSRWILIGRHAVQQWEGSMAGEGRLMIAIDWSALPEQGAHGWITVSAGTTSIRVGVTAQRPAHPGAEDPMGFVESGGVVAIDANHATGKHSAGGAAWTEMPNYGRTGSSMEVLPVTAPSFAVGQGPSLEYRFFSPVSGEVTVESYCAPTLPFQPKQGLRFAVAIDDAAPQIVDLKMAASDKIWSQAVMDNVRIMRTSFTLSGSGSHVVRYWAVDPGVVLQRCVVDCGGERPTYLGPPESMRWNPARP